RIVALSLTNTTAAAAGHSRISVNSANWMEWREQSRVFDDIAIARGAGRFYPFRGGRPRRCERGGGTWGLIPNPRRLAPLRPPLFEEEGPPNAPKGGPEH